MLRSEKRDLGEIEAISVRTCFPGRRRRRWRRRWFQVALPVFCFPIYFPTNLKPYLTLLLYYPFTFVLLLRDVVPHFVPSSLTSICLVP